MTGAVAQEPRLQWHDIVLSFVPPEKRTSRARYLLSASRLPLILLLQAALTWRLSDIVNDDEALYIHGGHVAIAHLLHGGAANAAALHGYGTYFSGAPNLYPVVAAVLDSIGGLALARFFSLCCMLVATYCVCRVGRSLFSDTTGLIAALAFALTGSVLFIGKLATYDAPCLALVAVAMALALTTRSVIAAPIVGAVLALACATKYAVIAVVPVVVALTFLAPRPLRTRWRGSLGSAVLRGGLATLAFACIALLAYRLWGSGVAAGIRFTTTSRRAADPAGTNVLLRSLVFDAGLLFGLALVAAAIMLRERAWRRLAIMTVMLGGGLIIQASSLRIHEFVSLDKHTAFTGLFCAVPAAVAIQWALRRRLGTRVTALVLIWLLLIDGMWRSNFQFSWPASILAPVRVVSELKIPGDYFSFDSDAAAFYTTPSSRVDWYPSASAYSIFGSGVSSVVRMERSHEFAGFLFQTTNLSAQNTRELRVLEHLLARDRYYFNTATFSVSPYQQTAEWELWIHYPAGYHGPKLASGRPA